MCYARLGCDAYLQSKWTQAREFFKVVQSCPERNSKHEWIERSKYCAWLILDACQKYLAAHGDVVRYSAFPSHNHIVPEL